MKDLILVKLGGSVITDKNRAYCLREANITRFAKEIKSALKKSKAKIIIGHGAGSFAHVPASKYRTKEGLIGKNSLFGMSVTEEAAKTLDQIVIKKFVSEKIPVYSFSPGTFIISDAKVYSKSYIDPIKKAVEIGLVPVVYGDVVLDKKIGFTIFSTEKIFAVLAKELSKEFKIKMVLVTDVDGVLDEKGKVIPRITAKNIDLLRPKITGAHGVDVTGGMLHKVEEAITLAVKLGIKTQIINGKKAGNLTKAILGNETSGTLVR